MGAAVNVVEFVDRQFELRKIEDRIKKMPQSTEDFFTRDDREQLYRVKFQSEKILQDLGDIKLTAKENAHNASVAAEAHEQRLRALEDDRHQLQVDVQTRVMAMIEQARQDREQRIKALEEGMEERLRALEDDRLQLRTQIKTSWWWIGLLSVGASGLVNLLIRLFLK